MNDYGSDEATGFDKESVLKHEEMRKTDQVQQEERTRQEQKTQENRRQEDDQRLEDERRRQDQQSQEERLRQERLNKELRKSEETRQEAQRMSDQLHESTVKTLQGNGVDDENRPKNGQAWIDGNAIVADYYKSYDSLAQQIQHKEPQEREAILEAMKEREAKQSEGKPCEGKELSPAVKKIQEYEKSVGDKVKEQMDGKIMMQGKNKTK